MKFELAFEALRHGYCITVQENKALWYRYDQGMQAVRAYVNSQFMSYKLDFPTDRIMTDRWQVGVFIEGNSPLWLDTENCFDIEQITYYAEIALEEREQTIGRHSMRGIEALIALRQLKKVKRENWRDGEYLATIVTPDGCKIAPSPKYNQYRGEDLHHLEDAVLLTDEILDDFLMDDWEVVE